ncbi:MAG: histidine--tRNA ligase [Elusimicrobia bacterium]|nr:histidine--tRNA ligase [Elusimicrobiota bacterium]
MKDFKAVRGVKDIVTYEEAAKWSAVIKKVESLFESYGYRKTFIPVIEHAELFSRSIGEETDIVSKEMYIFKDRKGRELALRPEGTAGVVRAMVENKMLQGNIREKVSYFGPMFRYERPQAGRYRQFYQLGCEVFGPASPMQDIEIVKMAVEAMSALNAQGCLTLKINSVGCDDCKKKYTQKVRKFLKEKAKDLCGDCNIRMDANTLRVFDCKESSCQELYRDIEPLSKNLCGKCDSYWKAYAEGVNKETRYITGLNPDFKIITDDYLVRGLDYYTGPVFEIESKSAGGAVIAGGRYDKLVKQLGGPDTPACGWAMGVERAASLYGYKGTNIPELYVIYLKGADERWLSETVVGGLRDNGVSVEEDKEDIPVGKKLKIADRKNVNWVIIMGEEEKKKGILVLKNLGDGSQIDINTGKCAEDGTGKMIREILEKIGKR